MKKLYILIIVLFSFFTFALIVRAQIIIGPNINFDPNRPVINPNINLLDRIPNWDFESGLSGWEKTGRAFEFQPTYGDNVIASRVVTPSTLFKMPLGGDYWKDVSFPIGHKGQYWIGTYENRRKQTDPRGGTQGDNPTGTLTSKAFTLNHNYITFLIGGGHDPEKLKMELLEQVSQVSREGITKCQAQPHSDGTIACSDGVYKPVPGTVKTGMNAELMRREWWSTRSLRGKTLRIRITDNASGPWGHINIDDIQFQDTKPSRTRITIGDMTTNQVVPYVFRPIQSSEGAVTLGFVDWDAPIWGITDMQAHLMSHLAFGGKIVHGAPDAGFIPASMSGCHQGGDLEFTGDEAKNRIDLALANSNPTHGGIGVDNLCGNWSREIVIGVLNKNYFHKARENLVGYPSFAEWPHFTSRLHQQMWHEWVERAWQGGLRVMVALAVHSETLAKGVSGNEPKSYAGSGDRQIAQIKAFADRHNFAEIAYSPAQLRDIVRRGRLAIIIGSELDHIGDLHRSGYNPDRVIPEAENAVRSEIRRLYELGLRYIFPVHLTNNKFGGTAFSDEATLNIANRVESGHWWNAECLTTSSANGITYKIANGLGAARILASVTSGLDLFENEPHYNQDCVGHRNTQGLTQLGQIALNEMMRLGMMIDIDHMSERTVEDVFRIVDTIPGNYPLSSGHNGFRSMYGNTENSRTDMQLEKLQKFGGMMGIGWGYGPDTSPNTKSFASVIAGAGGQVFTSSIVPYTNGNRCGGSSRFFAQSYLYALEKAPAVAFGTDINGLVETPGPRFGPLAILEREIDGINKSNICEGQRNGVNYSSDTPLDVQLRRAGLIGDNVPLQPSRTGNKTWSINTDGVAHYGLLPDFLQDLRNVGINPNDMTPLFMSADNFAQMWEKSLRASTNIR